MKKFPGEKSIKPPNLKTLEREIGQRIRQRRIELGLTQQDLADKLGLSYQQIQKYETGLNRISAGRLFLVAKELLTRLDYFFESETGEPPTRTVRRARGLNYNDPSLPREVQMALANLVAAVRKSK